MTLDAAVVLDLLAAAVWRRGPGTTRCDPEHPGIIECDFRALPVPEEILDRIRGRDIRSLYLGGQLPDGTTIGAAQSVLDIAPAHLTAGESSRLNRSCWHGTGPLPHHLRAQGRGVRC